jgi:hypothetical protein
MHAQIPPRARHDHALPGGLLFAGAAHWAQVLYRDPAIHLARPNIIKAPQDHAPRPFVAVIRPFRLLQRVHDPSVVELAITKVVADRLSGDRVFLQLHREWTPHLPTALEADLVVTGTISHLLVGGDKGTTAVGLMVEIHDAAPGSRCGPSLMPRTSPPAPTRTISL